MAMVIGMIMCICRSTISMITRTHIAVVMPLVRVIIMVILLVIGMTMTMDTMMNIRRMTILADRHAMEHGRAAPEFLGPASEPPPPQT